MKVYKASGKYGYTFYLDTGRNVFCQTCYPGDDGLCHKLDDDWPIERVIGQCGAEEVTVEDIDERLFIRHTAEFSSQSEEFK